jgi:hypothetical protein
MDPIATEVAAKLIQAGIAFYPTDHGHLRVPLPGGFGEFEIGAFGEGSEDSICCLVGDPWHLHGRSATLFNLVCEVFDGRCLLIEERAPGKASKKYVTHDFAEYLDDLHQCATYKVYNATPEELDRRRPLLARAKREVLAQITRNLHRRAAMAMFELGKDYEIVLIMDGEEGRAIWTVVEYQHPLIKVISPEARERVINTASPNFICAEKQ